MLALTRKRHEEIIVSFGGVDVVVSVVEIRSDKVRLGFEATPEVTIDRREVREAKLAAAAIAKAEGGAA